MVHPNDILIFRKTWWLFRLVTNDSSEAIRIAFSWTEFMISPIIIKFRCLFITVSEALKFVLENCLPNIRFIFCFILRISDQFFELRLVLFFKF